VRRADVERHADEAGVEADRRLDRGQPHHRRGPREARHRVAAEGLVVRGHAEYEIQVVFRAVYWSSACRERSRPMPDCLKPPSGVVGLIQSTVFTETVPARSLRATRWARLRSFVHTESA